MIQPNTMVNLKKRFAQANNNFVAAVNIIIIFIMNLVIKNSNNNILLKKKEKNISGLSQRHIVPDWIWTCDLRVSYLPTYNYLTCPNDLGYPTICVFRCFLIDLVEDLTINYFRHMFSYVIADTVANTSPLSAGTAHVSANAGTACRTLGGKHVVDDHQAF